MQSNRVVVAGSYGIGNLGDVALLQTVIRLLRRSGVAEEINVLSPSHGYLSKLVPGVRFTDPADASEVSADLLLYGGGTQFFEFRRTSLPEKLASAARSPRDALKRAARKLRRSQWRFERTACLGVGVGPFAAGSARERATRNLFRKMDFVAVRDTESLATCRSWGIGNALLRSDLCFADVEWQAEAAPDLPGEAFPVAAIVRDWPHTSEGAAYVDPLLGVADRYRSNGAPILFYSFCGPDDSGVTRRLKAEGHAVVVWDPEAEAPGQFVRRLQAHRIIVTARYHGALFAAMSGRPVICIDVEQKLRLAAEMLKVKGYLWRQPFVREELETLIARLATEHDAAAAATRTAVAEQRALGSVMAAEFEAFLRGM